jgi:predicted nucleic acid-binding protein
MVSLDATEMDAIVNVAAKFNLDFDDAYQYCTAQKQGLRIVSFDSGFDRTPEGRLLPSVVL